MAYPDESALTELDTLKNYFDPPIATGSVVRTNVLTGGSGYTSATVAYAGGDGSGAAGVCVLSGGAVVAIKQTVRGANYTAAPTPTISGDGAGATAEAILSNDDVLTGLITRVSNVIAELLPDLVIPASQTITETRNGQGGDRMILRKRPATAITSVTIDDSVIPQSTSRSTGWIFDAENNAVHYLGDTFTRGIQNVVIVYSAGLTAGDRRLGQLEEACLITCVDWYRERPHVGQASQSSGGIQNVSYRERPLHPRARMIVESLDSKALVLE